MVRKAVVTNCALGLFLLHEVPQMLFLILQIGLTMLVSIFVGTGLGYLLDRCFGTNFIIIIGICNLDFELVKEEKADATIAIGQN